MGHISPPQSAADTRAALQALHRLGASLALLHGVVRTLRREADVLARTATGAVRGYAEEAKGLLDDVERHAAALFAATNALAAALAEAPHGVVEAREGRALAPRGRLVDAADRLWSPDTQPRSALQMLTLLDPPDPLAASPALAVPTGIVDDVRAALAAVRSRD